MFEPVIWAEISKEALIHNIKELKRAVQPGVAFAAVVKADAYGHGAVETAKIALENGADMLAAARLEEGALLRESGINAPLLLFGYTRPENTDLIIKHNLIQTLFDLKTARAHAARIKDRPLKAHIKIDTGMGRLGIPHLPDMGIDGLGETLDLVAVNNIEIQGIYTHFAASDDRDKTYANLQYKRFNDLMNKLKQKGVQFRIRHAANSAAIIDMPHTHLDMVRAGIALYGLYPSPEVDKLKVDLKPVMSIRALITHVKTVSAGAKISYGMTFEAQKDTVVATIPVGYADGYSRLLSNTGHMLVHGKKAPVIGRVCMDQTMLDVTGIPGVKPGDTAVIMGREGEAEISADDLAQKLGTINYEIVTSVAARIMRKYI